MENLISYLTDKLGLDAQEDSVHRYRPKIMQSERFKRYDCHYILIQGIVVMLVSPHSKMEITGKKLVSDFRKICRYYNGVVLIWLPSVDFALRKTLVSNRVNFVVPGSQLYLPSLYIFLREKNLKAIIESDFLSIPAQVVVIYHLVKESLNGKPLSYVAKLVGYSPKTLSLVTAELTSKGIIEVHRDGRTSKYMLFKFKGKELWNAVKSLMQSPIIKTEYCGQYLHDQYDNPQRGIYRSGREAFNEYAHGYDYSTITTAAVFKNSLEGSGLTLENKSARSTLVEIWRYDPGKLAVAHYVDPCSLYLSMRDRVTPSQAKELSRIFRWWTWKG